MNFFACGTETASFFISLVVLVLISSIFYKQTFCTKMLRAAFLLLHFGSVIFWRKNIGAKGVNIMLLKLTP